MDKMNVRIVPGVRVKLKSDKPTATRPFMDRLLDVAAEPSKFTESHIDADSGEVVATTDILAAAQSESHVQSQIFPETGFDVDLYLDNLRRAFIEEALRRSGGVQTKAAALLRLSYRSFRHHCEMLNVGVKE